MEWMCLLTVHDVCFASVLDRPTTHLAFISIINYKDIREKSLFFPWSDHLQSLAWSKRLCYALKLNAGTFLPVLVSQAVILVEHSDFACPAAAELQQHHSTFAVLMLCPAHRERAQQINENEISCS